MTLEDDGSAGRLMRAVAAAKTPVSVLSTWNGVVPEPAVGQVWRARRGAAAEIVLLLSIGSNAVTIAPVTLDVGYSDGDAVILDPSESSLGVHLTVWLGLTMPIPMRNLDRCAGTVGVVVGGAAESAFTEDLRGVGRSGHVLVSPADAVHEYRAHLEDQFEELAAASAATAGTGALPTVLAENGLSPAELAATLSITPQRALALLRGQAALEPVEADRLADRLHLNAAELRAANPAPPAELIARIDQPRRRRQVEQLAQRRHESEDAARAAIAYAALAMAARTSGDSIDPAWDERLDRYFSAVLDD